MVREGRRAAEVHLARRGGVAGVPARGRDFGQGKTGHSRLHKRAVAEPGEDSERGRSPRDMFIYDFRSVRTKQHFPYSAEDGIFRHMKIVEYSYKIGIMWNILIKSGIF